MERMKIAAVYADGQQLNGQKKRVPNAVYALGALFLAALSPVTCHAVN